MPASFRRDTFAQNVCVPEILRGARHPSRHTTPREVVGHRGDGSCSAYPTLLDALAPS